MIAEDMCKLFGPFADSGDVTVNYNTYFIVYE